MASGAACVPGSLGGWRFGDHLHTCAIPARAFSCQDVYPSVASRTSGSRAIQPSSSLAIKVPCRLPSQRQKGTLKQGILPLVYVFEIVSHALKCRVPLAARYAALQTLAGPLLRVLMGLNVQHEP